MLHPAGNIAEHLVAAGLARVVDWHAGMLSASGGMEKLRAAERWALRCCRNFEIVDVTPLELRRRKGRTFTPIPVYLPAVAPEKLAAGLHSSISAPLTEL